MKSYKVFIINSAVKDEALKNAIKRRDFHSKLGSCRHWKDSIKDEYFHEYYGNLAHLLFVNRLKDLGFEKYIKSAPLFVEDLSQLPEWDCLFLDQKIEIKGIPPDSIENNKEVKRKRLLVKCSEFKNLDMYVAIKFWDDDKYSFCGFATGNELKRTIPKSFGYEKAYWMLLDELPHSLCLLNEN